MTEIIIKPIVYGSIAFYLGKKAEEFISHRWCVYVRGVHNEDISYFIKEVTFTLHPSFTDNVRKVSKFPFEVYECGWGEFDIKIMIYFHEESLKPVEIIHSLKLYPTQSHAALSAKKPVISENYEEIIFVNPKKHFLETLNSVKPETKNIIQMNIDEDMNSIYRDKKHTFSIFEDEKKSEYDNKIRVSTVDNQMNDMKMDEKIEENQLSNYEMSMAGNIDKMYQNNMDSLSVVSNSQNNV
jgi:YEATS domain-containing protein 4